MGKKQSETTLERKTVLDPRLCRGVGHEKQDTGAENARALDEIVCVMNIPLRSAVGLAKNGVCTWRCHHEVDGSL